jgi:hypothetical protein
MSRKFKLQNIVVKLSNVEQIMTYNIIKKTSTKILLKLLVIHK